jgi:predicted Rossmann fold nucleotide-binding protein DprA/Smf involved in DNA uptake
MNALVAEGIGLVSGYGRGLDRTTFETTLNIAGGHAIAVLPMGLSAFAQTTSKLNKAVETGQVVLVSPFTPNTPFQEQLADARNLLIDYLALALLVPEVDETVPERAAAALNRGISVFVGLTDTPTPHHRALLEQGALLLTDAGEVVEMVQQAMIDATLLEPTEESPPPPLPSPQATPGLNEDFALRTEDVEPIDSDEALEILSLGGEIPEVLRQRLQKPDDSE